MSLGRPDLYIGNRLMQTAKGDPIPALAGLALSWGTDNALDMAPAATLSGQLLVKGAMPDFLDVGAPVGLIDPSSSRCLFAGTLQPLKAARDPQISTAHRVSFTATAPVAELEKHNLIDLDWTTEDTSSQRRGRLQAAMPRGWALDGAAGWDYLQHGHQRYQSVALLDLLSRYVRGSRQRFADTSAYVPGAGLRKRLTITEERLKTAVMPTNKPDEMEGMWLTDTPYSASGTAILPAGAVSNAIEWEKTPADLVTGVQATTWGKALIGSAAEDDSSEHEWPLDWVTDTSALRASYGSSIVRIETMLSPQNLAATREALGYIIAHWIETKTGWRPTTLTVPDSRRIGRAPLLNLLAVDTRATAGVSVPQAAGLPAPIRAFVLGGTATWTGKQWTTDLTLGRTQ